MVESDMCLDNIEFILSHFNGQEFLFPRSIMTLKTNGQVFVESKDQIIKYFKEANFMDYRINGYPYHQNKDIRKLYPSFIFIDLDLSLCSACKYPIRKLDYILKQTLKKMSEEINGHPTVLWTGGGYHIYQPIKIVTKDEEKQPLESFKEFDEFIPFMRNDLTTEFIRFASKYFTNGKGDPKHNPSIYSCLIRIPGTINSKCLNKGLSIEESKVKILQKWNGKRTNAEALVHEFRIWLTQQEINLTQDKRKEASIRKQQYHYSSNRKNQSNNVLKIEWIEKLLQTPIEDYRKECLWRIIGPYLLNVKNLSELQASKMMEDWLNKCNKVRGLDFEPRMKIYSIIKGNKGYRPISLSKLKEEDSNLFKILTAQ